MPGRAAATATSMSDAASATPGAARWTRAWQVVASMGKPAPAWPAWPLPSRDSLSSALCPAHAGTCARSSKPGESQRGHTPMCSSTENFSSAARLRKSRRSPAPCTVTAASAGQACRRLAATAAASVTRPAHALQMPGPQLCRSVKLAHATGCGAATRAQACGLLPSTSMYSRPREDMECIHNTSKAWGVLQSQLHCQSSCRHSLQALQCNRYLYASSAAETRSTLASGRSRRASIAAGSTVADGGRLPGSAGAGMARNRATASSRSAGGASRPSSAAYHERSLDHTSVQQQATLQCGLFHPLTLCDGTTRQPPLRAPGCVCSR